jgi:dipeptidyl aminopeptidase/acylaminoacyl peptidase
VRIQSDQEFVTIQELILSLGAGYRHPGEFSIDYEDLMIPCKDGVKINAWLMKQRDFSTRPTLIFFHGNAGSESTATAPTWWQMWC